MNTKKHTAETKRRMSEALRNNKRSLGHKGNAARRPVVQLSLEREELGRFPSVKAASEAVGISSSAISIACSAGRRAGGFYWARADGSKHGTLCRRVARKDAEGNVRATYKSVTSAAKAMNVSKSAITHAAKNEERTIAGWYWAYVD